VALTPAIRWSSPTAAARVAPTTRVRDARGDLPAAPTVAGDGQSQILKPESIRVRLNPG
jgi:hypothetical protein